MSDAPTAFRERLLELSKQIELLAHEEDRGAKPMRLRRASPGEERTPEWWLGQAREIYTTRRMRDRYLPASYFGEPAWDILLELFILGLHDQCATVKRACLASGVPMTTALRSIGILLDDGLIRRASAPHDRRVTYLSLTPRAVDAIRRYILARQALCNRPTPEFMLTTRGEGE